ncbi:MAG: nuclear transport factor 2 family protein [Methanoregulaceae archaeon]|nr:nuclear transport factor 2 family protein [Methanoregulaceae archaeon]
MSTIESLIHAYFDAFNRGDVEGQLATLHPEVVHEINEGDAEIGIEAFRKFKAHMDTTYREQIRDLVVMGNGSRGAAEFFVDGEYLVTDGGLPEATGQRYSIRAAIFAEERDGLIGRMTSCYNLKGWIAAIS